MRRDLSRWSAFLFVLLAGVLAAPVETPAADDPTKTKSKDKEKTKSDDGVAWSPVIKLEARAPATAAGTFQATREIKINEKVVRFTTKLESQEGKGGNVVLTLYKLGKPVKKIPVMKHNRAGEKEVMISVEPGDYKLEVNVNNVTATVSVEEGKKK